MQSENKINAKQIFHLYETDRNDTMLQMRETETPYLLEKNGPDFILNLFAKYLNNYPKTGYIKFEATTNYGTIPMKNVKITVIKSLGADFYVSKILYTDMNGQTEALPLSTKSSKLSLNPNYKNPYATYDVTAETPGFLPCHICNVPIFENITSIQPINLIADTIKTVQK